MRTNPRQVVTSSEVELPIAEYVARPATKADLPMIREIYNWAVENTTATFDTEPRTEASMLSWYESHGPRHPIFVFERAGVVAGWGSLSAWALRGGYRDTVEFSVYVHPDARGNGIGGAIVDVLIDAAKTLQHHCIVSCNTEGNDPIEKIVSRRGFEKIGMIPEMGLKFNRYYGLVFWQRLLETNKEYH